MASQWTAALPARLGRRGLAGLCAAAALAGAGGVLAAPAGAQGPTTRTFWPTDTMQTWSVPTGVRAIAFQVTGGPGGGGSGGQQIAYATTATGVLTIPAGVTALDVAVGGSGTAANLGGSAPGGWPNGGAAGTNAINSGAGGGGSSDIRPSGAPFTSALIVVGGGGGAGGYGGTSDGGEGGVGGLNGAYFGKPGAGSDGGAGGAGGQLQPGTSGQGGAGQGVSGSNTNSGGGGGGGGGWNPGAGGGAGTADAVSFRSGGGGGGGGGNGAVDTQYVAGASEYMQQIAGQVQLTYLDVDVTTIPSLAVGTHTSGWLYDAGTEATFAVTAGSLPPGLTLDGYSGLVRGVPTQAGTYSFTVEASYYGDGANPMITDTETTVSVNTGGPASLLATSATGVGTTTATANGSVLAGAAPVTGLQCAYSTTNPGGGWVIGAAVAAAPASIEPTPTGAATAVSCALSGLASNQTYYYQLQGTQSGSSVRSGTATFTTGSAVAQPTTYLATSVTGTTAAGNGVISATQNVTAIACRVATTLAGVATGASFAATPASTTGIVTNRPVTCAMTGLTPNTTYHYAFFATDSAGTAMSPAVQSFTTRVAPPQLGTIVAGTVTSTSAAITGSVIPTNEPVTSVYCRYAKSPGNPARGTAVAATPFQLGAAPVVTAASCDLTGLAPATTYLVRMEATDRDGTAAAPNVVRLTTAAAVPPAPTPTAAAVTIRSAFALGTRQIRARATVNVAGALTLVASRAAGTRRAQACKATRQLAAAGTYTITCTVGPATRRALRTRSIPIRVRLTLAPSSGAAATATVNVLLQRTPAASRSGTARR